MQRQARLTCNPPSPHPWRRLCRSWESHRARRACRCCACAPAGTSATGASCAACTACGSWTSAGASASRAARWAAAGRQQRRGRGCGSSSFSRAGGLQVPTGPGAHQLPGACGVQVAAIGSQLEVLAAVGCDFINDAVCRVLPRVRALNIRLTPITDAGLLALAGRAGFRAGGHRVGERHAGRPAGHMAAPTPQGMACTCAARHGMHLCRMHPCPPSLPCSPPHPAAAAAAALQSAPPGLPSCPWPGA